MKLNDLEGLIMIVLLNEKQKPV